MSEWMNKWVWRSYLSYLGVGNDGKKVKLGEIIRYYKFFFVGFDVFYRDIYRVYGV